MLDRMTGGLYRSTPHRVRLNRSGRDRLSFPLFFDPDFDVRIEPIRSAEIDDHADALGRRQRARLRRHLSPAEHVELSPAEGDHPPP